MEYSVTKVILTLCTSAFTDFRTLHAIHVIFREGVEPKASGKSSRVRTAKTGGSDPKNFRLSRPKFCSGSLPPRCSHHEQLEKSDQQWSQPSSHARFSKARMQERRKVMAVLKAPPKQPKNATLQVRIDENLKYKVDKYAEFLETTGAYVVSEALRLVFNKDAEFKE